MTPVGQEWARDLLDWARTLLIDLGSTNGTTLDGKAVARAELHDGARIGLGETVLVFRQPAG